MNNETNIAEMHPKEEQKRGVKKQNKDGLFIHHQLCCQSSGEGYTRCYVLINKNDGAGEVVIEKTINKRMPMSDIRKAENLYEKLTDTRGGLISFGIDDLLKYIERGP